MKIYFNGRFLTQGLTGVQRYAAEILKELDNTLSARECRNNEYVLVVPKYIKYNLKLQTIKTKQVGILKGHLWEQIELPFYTRGGFLVDFCNCAPLLKRRQLVVFHDAAVRAIPEAYSKVFRLWYNIMFYVLGKKIERVFTVSEFSKNELHRYYHISLEKIQVAYNAVDHIKKIIPNETVLTQYRLERYSYVLAVGSRSVSKNFSLVLEAARKLPSIPFVIAGGYDKAITTYSEMENVRFVGYVPDEALVALYKNAKCFVFPSLYEGFGIPPIEAMACNCPVVVAKTASMPEVCGEAALYCDPYDASSLVEQISKLNAPNVRNELVMRGQHRSAIYSWKASSEIFLKEIGGDMG